MMIQLNRDCNRLMDINFETKKFIYQFKTEGLNKSPLNTSDT